jgi:hypothetical protein
MTLVYVEYANQQIGIGQIMHGLLLLLRFTMIDPTAKKKVKKNMLHAVIHHRLKEMKRSLKFQLEVCVIAYINARELKTYLEYDRPL